MNDIKIYHFGMHEVREIEKDGETWFVAKDVADILGYESAKDMVRNLEEDEKGGQIVPTLGGNQESMSGEKHGTT